MAPFRPRKEKLPKRFQNDLPRSATAPALPAMKSKPQLLCWLTCDGVHLDPATGKPTILGVFSNINALRFPVSHPQLIWFLSLTDCAAGEHMLKISFGLEGSAPKPVIERSFESPGPTQQINLINEIRGLTFPMPGSYAIVVEVNDELLVTTDLTVGAARG